MSVNIYITFLVRVEVTEELLNKCGGDIALAVVTDISYILPTYIVPIEWSSMLVLKRDQAYEELTK